MVYYGDILPQFYGFQITGAILSDSALIVAPDSKNWKGINYQKFLNEICWKNE